MGFVRKTSPARETKLTRELPAPPASLPPDLARWYEDLRAGLKREFETIEEALANLAGRSEAASAAASVAQQTADAANAVEAAGNRLIFDADVAPAAAIQESKLALHHPTHSNANDPTPAQKAALLGTAGTPGNSNRYVTDLDSRLAPSSSGQDAEKLAALLGEGGSGPPQPEHPALWDQARGDGAVRARLEDLERWAALEA